MYETQPGRDPKSSRRVTGTRPQQPFLTIGANANPSERTKVLLKAKLHMRQRNTLSGDLYSLLPHKGIVSTQATIAAKLRRPKASEGGRGGGKGISTSRWIRRLSNSFRTPRRQYMKCFCFAGIIGVIACISQWPFILYCPWINQYSPPVLFDVSGQDLAAYADTLRDDSDDSSVFSNQVPYDVFDCPTHPFPGYPHEFPIMDVLANWPTNEVRFLPSMVHQTLCVFDFQQTSNINEKLQNYRQAEVPFVVRNDPEALRSSMLWNHNTKEYLHWKLQRKVFHAEYSRSNSMLFWRTGRHQKIPQGFTPPTSIRPITFEEWHHRAVAKDMNEFLEENAYMRIDGCLPGYRRNCAADWRYPFGTFAGRHFLTRQSDANFLFDDLKFFDPRHNASLPYGIDIKRQHGIQCRFGAAGLTAEAHFDGERNWIAMLSGKRRYILSRPDACQNMALYPIHHPLERHTRVDWTSPNLTEYPQFSSVTANEVVLRESDMLYLPTYWFHHIISLKYNIQCNIRSGYSLEFDETIDNCGFLYPLPY